MLGHVIVAHASLGMHSALQLHELVHDRSPHAPVPLQVSVHLPGPHVIGPHAGAPDPQVALHAPVPLHVIAPHALAPVHVMSQPPVPEHEMSPHAPGAVHEIWHRNPSGHAIAAPPPPLITQVLVLPNVHPPLHRLGHTGTNASTPASNFTLGSTTQ